MKKLKIFLTLSVLVFAISCKSDKKEDANVETEIENTENTENNEQAEEEKVDISKLSVTLEARSNSNASGNVLFSQDTKGVTMFARLSGLTEGVHAIHIHEKADCSAEDGTSTGGHWNPTRQKHGSWGDKDGYHKGDIGNLTADAEGNASFTFITNEWCIGCGNPNKDILGKAIIVHQGEDDFTSQPTGAAGGRVSCGGIIQ